jgi:hypothetical protein
MKGRKEIIKLDWRKCKISFENCFVDKKREGERERERSREERGGIERGN